MPLQTPAETEVPDAERERTPRRTQSGLRQASEVFPPVKAEPESDNDLPMNITNLVDDEPNLPVKAKEYLRLLDGS